MRLRLCEVEREDVRHLDSRRDETIRVVLPTCALPDCIHVLRARLQVVVYQDPTTLPTIQPCLARQVVARSDADREDDNVAAERGPVRKLESGECSLVVRHESLNGCAAKEPDAHAFDAAQDNLATLGIELSGQGIRLSVDDSNVLNRGKVINSFRCLEAQKAAS